MNRMSLMGGGLASALALAAASGTWAQETPAQPVQRPLPEPGPMPSQYFVLPPLVGPDPAPQPQAPPPPRPTAAPAHTPSPQVLVPPDAGTLAPGQAPAPRPVAAAQPLEQAPPPQPTAPQPAAAVLVPEPVPPPAAAPAPESPSPQPPAPALTAPAPAPVQAEPLRAPDLFSAEAAPTGIGADLWKGSSIELARIVMPMLAVKPISPAAAAFGRRVMSTGSVAPAGGGADADLAAARIGALLALGDAPGAHAMLEHTPGVRQSASLSQVAAEADLVLGHEDEACAVGDSLTVGRDGAYWRRLRAYCQLKAGDIAGAQLTFDLASEQSKDDVYTRLMGAAVSHTPPGGASLRNGLEYALSRRLQLDMAPVMDKAWPPIAPILAKDPAAPQAAQAAAAVRVAYGLNDTARAATLAPSLRAAALSLADDKMSLDLADALAVAGGGGDPQIQAGMALYLASGAPGGSKTRAALAGFDIGRSIGNQARLLEMEAAAAAGNRGDTALLALWAMIDAGEGPPPADRARIVWALTKAGFRQDARAYALEGVLALQPPPAQPPRAPVKPPARRRKR